MDFFTVPTLTFGSCLIGCTPECRLANHILRLDIDLSLFHPVARSYRRS
jgi:hypothetical protein